MDITLVMFTAAGERKDFDIKKSTAILGRNSDCDFQIPLHVISRRHCQLQQKNGKLFVRDLGSSNGTYVNNKRIQEQELHATDTLTLGPVVFTVVIDGSPKEITPRKTLLDGKKLPPEPKPQAHDITVDTVDVEADAHDSGGELDLADSNASHDSDIPLGDDPLAALEAMSKKKN